MVERKPQLPIDAVLPDLVAELEARGNAVLEATPGAGKTTRVPPALLAAAFRKDREILVLEPRRLAAKMAAHRVADELGERIGETVGYHFRFENVGGPRTRIRFLTEGMFVRRLLSDPALERVAAVIIDEFHERHLQGDFALAALKRLQSTLRPDLRLVVMSATLDTAQVAEYLGGARIFRVEARRFEIDVRYLELDGFLDKQVLAGVKQAADQDGDILVFLPGVGEIRRAQETLRDFAGARGVVVFPLYGDLSREEQDQAVRPIAGKQKVILATNVAETSLTIEGVRSVVDSGLARVASYSWWSGLPALRTRPVSRASAIQRAGRAGRMGPGQCIRLYSKQSFEGRPAYETPEIQRADLAQTLLELAMLGVRDPMAFPWFEPPLPSAVEASARLLYRLGAVDRDGALSALGRRMAEMPAHPRLTRLALEGSRMGMAREAATVAAMLSERNDSCLDIMVELERYRPLGSAERVRNQLLRHCESKKGDHQAVKGDLRKALLVGFPDRVAKRRSLAASVARNSSGGKVELVFGSGGSALLEDAGRLAARDEYYVAIDIEERTKSQRVCRSICAIEPEWLFDLEPEGVVEKSEVFWDAERERVLAATRMVYDGLVLAETKGAAPPEDIASVLAKEAVAVGIAKFVEPEKLATLTHRLLFVKERLPDETLPELSGAGLERFLREVCLGKSSFAELRESDLLSQILYTLSMEQRAKLDRFAPEMVQLPGGRRVLIHYEAGKNPWIESRLQDFFGMRTGPTVLGGKVALVLHLLAPNQRAVQVTSDLSGFWERIYPDLRRELGRRYPRHSWPEDPFTAQPPPPRGR